MDLRAYEKLIKLSDYERMSLFQTKRTETHEEKVLQKMERVNEVRELAQAGFSRREISRRTGLALATIQKYLDNNYTPIHASYGKKKDGLLSFYIKSIDSLLEQGVKGTVIELQLREAGYMGSSSTIRHYITDWKRRLKHF